MNDLSLLMFSVVCLVLIGATALSDFHPAMIIVCGIIAWIMSLILLKKDCPNCGKRINLSAKVCHRCHRDVVPATK
jgi:preprotein translocase subunit SecF